MLDNNLIQSTSSWPFVEVRKLLKDSYFLDISNIKDYQGLPRITHGILDK